MKVFYPSWYKDLEKISDFINELRNVGFDGVEFSIDYPLCYKKPITKEFFMTLKKEGLLYGIHLPWRDISLASPIEEIRKASVSSTMECLREIIDLEPYYVLIHVTTEQSDCGFRDRDCINAGRKSLTEISDLTKSEGIDLLVETTHNRCCGGEEQIPYLLKDLDGVYVCLDIAHIISRRLHKWGTLYRANTVMDELPPALVERIKLIHLHGYIADLKHGIIITHQKPKKDFIREFLGKLGELSILPRVKGVVIEAFRDRDVVKDISTLRYAAKEVRKY